MASTSSTIHIEASAEKLMGILQDVENYPKWTSGISNITITDKDADGLPSRAKFQLDGGPISDQVELAYVWHSDSVEWHLVSGKTITSLDGAYRIISSESGCEVTYELSAEVNLPIPSFIKSAGEKTIITSALQGLKDFAK